MSAPVAQLVAPPSAGPSRAGYHRIATYLACPQRFAYAHVLGLQPVRESEALALGSLLHIARMHFYLGRAGRPGAQDPVEAMRTAPARIAWAFARAARIWPRYVAWAGARDDFVVLDVEREYEVRVGGRLFTARIDLVCARDGQVWADDLKSTSGDVRRAYEQYEMAGQMAMLGVIGRAVLASMYARVAPRGFGGVTITALGTGDGGEPAWRTALAISPAWAARVVEAVAQAAREIEVTAGARADAWNWPINPEACRGDRWGACRWLALCERGREACDEYDVAADMGTRLREGSGR